MINFNLKLEKNCLFDNMYIRYTKARVAQLDKVFENELKGWCAKIIKKSV